MSEQNHTPEPWSIDRFGGINAGEELLLLGGIRTPMTAGQRMDEGKANARRIVACVNACAGISTDALEAEGSAVMGWNRAARKLINATKQRDELLSALEYHQEQTRPIQATIDLIASVKGGEE